MKLSVLTVFLSLAPVCAAFLSSRGGLSLSKAPALSTSLDAAASSSVDQAIQLFDKAHPFGREPPKKSMKFVTYGMPQRDIDGTPLRRGGSNPNKRFTDITKQEAKSTFQTLAKLYGEDRALNMVKALPTCLAFDKQYFAASLKEWSAVFGEEESKDMVQRNPGLLAVKPFEAAAASEQTMVFSYLVAYTRPIGPVVLPALLLLLLTPIIEAVTGVDLWILN